MVSVPKEQERLMQETERQDILRLHRFLPRTGSLLAFALSSVAIAFFALSKFLLDAWAGSPVPPFITFYPAVVIASLLGGPSVGLAAAAVTLAFAWFLWIPPAFSFALLDRVSAATVAIYVFTSPLIALAAGLARITLDRVAASEAERSAAARESVHRTKNLIAVVQAISAKISREVTTVAEFNKILGERLQALSLAQNLLLRRDWQDADLDEVLHTALAPFLPNPGLTVGSGEHVLLPARHVRGLCMALYELCTNAMKHGALAYGRGPATVSWHHVGDDCVLEWREELSGSHGARPHQPGFGTILIRMALSNEKDTVVNYEVTSTLVLASFRWPDAARTKRANLQEMRAGEPGLSPSAPDANQAGAAATVRQALAPSWRPHQESGLGLGWASRQGLPSLSSPARR
jgi:two-component sensor histidine kinase